MTLQQLTYLVTVADCGNITEAAEKLFISQPSLSAAIHNLEKEMGVTAFTRSNKGVTVTREGEELLSFARTLAHNPSILVMDEATANIDTETEILIQEALEKLMDGRTTIMVAHRLSTIQHADCIMVMHKGRICERGTHRELLEQDGIYRKLYELQIS